MSNPVNIRFGPPDNSPSKPQLYSPVISNAQGFQQQPLSPSYRGNTPKITFNNSNTVSPNKINTDPAENPFPVIYNPTEKKQLSEKKEQEVSILPVPVNKVDDESICSRTCWIIATVIALVLLAIALVFALNVFARTNKKDLSVSSSLTSANANSAANSNPSSTNTPASSTGSSSSPTPEGNSSVSPLPPSPNVAYVPPKTVQPLSITPVYAKPTFIAAT